MKTKHIMALMSLLALSFSMAANQTLHAQTQVELSRTIVLENDSNEEEVIIPINESDLQLELMISAYLTNGRIDIEIYSPSGKREWNLAVESQTESYEGEEVTGTIKKFLADPDRGEWVVKLKPENASGIVRIDTKTN